MSEARKPPTEPTQGPKPTPKDDRATVSFSLPQILGGALAAVTVATVGSSLGTAGTVFGAAIASVIGAIAGTLYTAGIDRTSRHAHHALRRGLERIHPSADPVLPDGSPASTSQAPGAASTPAATQDAGPVDAGAGGGTRVMPAASGASASAGGSDATATPGDTRNPSTTQPASAGGAGPAATRPQRRRLIWRMAGSALAIFLIAAVAITGWELATGSTLSGTPGETSFSRARPADPAPTATVHHTTTASPEPTTTGSPTSSPTPTHSATPQATPTATTTQTPTSTPAPQSSATTTQSSPLTQERVEPQPTTSG